MTPEEYEIIKERCPFLADHEAQRDVTALIRELEVRKEKDELFLMLYDGLEWYFHGVYDDTDDGRDSIKRISAQSEGHQVIRGERIECVIPGQDDNERYPVTDAL